MSYKRAADVRAVGDALRSIRNVGDVHVKQSAEVLGEERASIKERGQRCAGTRRVDGVASMASRRWRAGGLGVRARRRGDGVTAHTPFMRSVDGVEVEFPPVRHRRDHRNARTLKRTDAGRRRSGRNSANTMIMRHGFNKQP